MFVLAVNTKNAIYGRMTLWPGINLLTCRRKVEGKGKAIPLNPWTGPLRFQEVEAPRFQDSRHIKVVRLSALRTGRVGGKYYFHIMTPKVSKFLRHCMTSLQSRF
jgi:hypothetical protein